MPDSSVSAVYLHRIVDCSFLVPNVLSVSTLNKCTGIKPSVNKNYSVSLVTMF